MKTRHLLCSTQGTICRILGIVQSAGDDRMSGQWLWWSKWVTTFWGPGMTHASSSPLPSVVRTGQVQGLKSTKRCEIPGAFFNIRVHSSWANLTACFLGDLWGASCSYRFICGIFVEKMALSFLVYFTIWSKINCAVYLGWLTWKFCYY